MFNKNYIIVGVVIVLAVIGGIIFFSAGDSSAPDSEALEHGIKNLTRNSAAEMIKTKFNSDPYHTAGAKTHILGSYKKEKGSFSIRAMQGIETEKINQIKALAEGGLVNIISEEKSGAYGYVYVYFNFTDQAKQFLLKEREDVGYVMLGEVASVEVTGLTEPAEVGGMKIRQAEFTAQFKPTPFGKIIDEKKSGEELKSTVQFVLYDDGWRIR